MNVEYPLNMITELDFNKLDSQEQERFENHLKDLLGLEDDTYIPPYDSDERVYFLAELLNIQYDGKDIPSIRREVNLELSRVKRSIAFGLCNSFNEYRAVGGFTEDQINAEYDHYAEERKKRRE